MTQNTTAAPVHAWDIAWGNQPEGGSKSVSRGVNFAIDNPATIDFQNAQLRKIVEFVQSMWVDNTLNPNALFITCNPTKQIIRIEAGRCGYVPVLCGKDSPSFSFSCPGSLLTIPVHFLNCAMPAGEYGSGFGSTGADFSANKPALLANLIATVPAGPRAFIEVQNQSAAQIQVVLDDGAGNNISIVVLAGAGANVQGSSWTSLTFNGRARIYATNAADQVMVHQD